MLGQLQKSKTKQRNRLGLGTVTPAGVAAVRPSDGLTSADTRFPTDRSGIPSLAEQELEWSLFGRVPWGSAK